MDGVSGVVLAGGQSRRMGRPKATIQFAGQTLLERTIDALRHVTPWIAVAGPQSFASLAGDVPLIGDAIPDAGPLSAIAGGLRWSRHPHCLVAACDMPFLSVPFLHYLVRLAPEAEAIVPRSGGRTYQTLAVYAVTCLDRIEAMLDRGDRRVHGLLDSVETRYVEEDEIRRHDPTLRTLMNLNTPADLAEAERILRND